MVTLHFGIESAMSQMETLFFGGAFDMTISDLQAIVLAGFLRVEELPT
ncbi:hypothetical protein QUF63_14285 [Anaerolineales bacterium HSG25]|nr:hypothetical protein [Anaerolineales bacterium HSG25]